MTGEREPERGCNLREKTCCAVQVEQNGTKY